MYLRRAMFIMAVISLFALGGMNCPIVTRGGAAAGVGTVTVMTGHGVWATWSVRTGTLQSALLKSSKDETRLEIGASPPTWFVQVESGDIMPMQYTWRGYRLDGDQVILLHQLSVPGGSTFNIEERPKSVVGPGGLLSLQRTFSVLDAEDSRGSPLIIQRIRTGTDGGVTLPTKTNGRLQPLGLNDNFQADVVFRQDGPTVITTVFNGHWVDEPAQPVMTKESNS